MGWIPRAAMIERGFIAQLRGYGLTTAEIHFYLADAPSLLQLFDWQECDLAADFPVLFEFLGHWRREIEAARHSVGRIIHHRLIRPTEWRAVNGVIASHAPAGPWERGRTARRSGIRAAPSQKDHLLGAVGRRRGLGRGGTAVPQSPDVEEITWGFRLGPSDMISTLRAQKLLPFVAAT
jgi:uncharacterized protein Usg